MALRSITLPDLEEGRGLWLELRTYSCSLSNSGLYQSPVEPLPWFHTS